MDEDARGTGPSAVPARIAIDVLACPGCRGDISETSAEELSCTQCARTFPIDRGVVRMLPENPMRAGGWDLKLRPDQVRADPDGEGKTIPALEDRRFRQGSESRRKNARERAIVDWFLGRAPKGSWIVDVPCGMGRFSDLAHRRETRLCSIDLNHELVLHASTRVPGSSALSVQGDIAALPLRSGSMNAAICVRISFYLEDGELRSTLAEVGRVAKDILMSYRSSRSPVAWLRRLRKRRSGGKSAGKHYRSYAQIRELAAAAGLRVAGKIPYPAFLHLTQFVWLTREESSA